ncbi:MAG: NADH-quinone oxidoreductase subunit C [Lutibacter sp.]|nr:NADH-quinone oxidoreductase subunit C [Lutibacter sp.]
MSNEALQTLINQWIPELEFTEEGVPFLTVTVPAASLHPLMHRLRNDQETCFDYLFCLTGVDWGDTLGVVYHLESTQHRHILVVKVATEDRDNPVFHTVSDIWKTACFHEREAFDFLGITFDKHPNLKRLFLTEDWKGFPLRKDYEDNINMIVK